MTRLSKIALFVILIAAFPAQADVIYIKPSDVATLRYFLPPPAVRYTFYPEGSTLPESGVYRVLPGFIASYLPNPPVRATYVTDGSNIYVVKRDRRVIDAAVLY